MTSDTALCSFLTLLRRQEIAWGGATSVSKDTLVRLLRESGDVELVGLSRRLDWRYDAGSKSFVFFLEEVSERRLDADVPLRLVTWELLPYQPVDFPLNNGGVDN
jgi:hypothetical protein